MTKNSKIGLPEPVAEIISGKAKLRICAMLDDMEKDFEDVCAERDRLRLAGDVLSHVTMLYMMGEATSDQVKARHREWYAARALSGDAKDE